MANRPHWQNAQIDILRQLYSTGLSARQIYESQLLPYSKNAIHKALLRYNISPIKRKIFKFNDNQRQRLKSFLYKNYKGRTPQDLTDLWNNLYPMLPVNKERIISYLTRLNIKLPQSEVLRITRLRRNIALLKSKNLSPDVLLCKIKEANKKVMSKRLAKNRDIWTGMPLTPQDVYDTE